MNIILKEVLFFGVIFGIVGWCMWGLNKKARKVHTELDKFKAEADATDSLPELSNINARLIQYARRNCIRGLSEHAREVNIFICTKADTIRKLKHTL